MTWASSPKQILGPAGRQNLFAVLRELRREIVFKLELSEGRAGNHEAPPRKRRVPIERVRLATKDDADAAAAFSSPNRIALCFLGSLAGRFAPSIPIYFDDSVCVHPSLRSSHPFLLGQRRRHSDAPEIAQVTRFEAGKTTLPRETERRRGRVREAGRREGEMSGDRRRSLVGRGRDGERSSRDGTRETRTAVKDGPSLGIYRTISHAHSSLCFPEEGPGFMRGFLIIAIHRHPLVPFFARSQRLFESSPPLLRPAERENRALFNCSSSHFSSAIYLATAIMVRSVENSFKSARPHVRCAHRCFTIDIRPPPAPLRSGSRSEGAGRPNCERPPGGREIASKGNTRDKVHARSSPRVAAPAASPPRGIF